MVKFPSLPDSSPKERVLKVLSPANIIFDELSLKAKLESLESPVIFQVVPVISKFMTPVPVI